MSSQIPLIPILSISILLHLPEVYILTSSHNTSFCPLKASSFPLINKKSLLQLKPHLPPSTPTQRVHSSLIRILITCPLRHQALRSTQMPFSSDPHFPIQQTGDHPDRILLLPPLPPQPPHNTPKPTPLHRGQNCSISNYDKYTQFSQGRIRTSSQHRINKIPIPIFRGDL